MFEVKKRNFDLLDIIINVYIVKYKGSSLKKFFLFVYFKRGCLMLVVNVDDVLNKIVINNIIEL